MSERLLVCGSRTWTERDQLWDILDEIHAQRDVALVIHGAARGADTMAGEWARARGIPVMVFPADWLGEGRAAGPIRNQRMLDVAKPTLGVAFAVDPPNSRGTQDMMRRLERAHVPAFLIGTLPPITDEQLAELQKRVVPTTESPFRKRTGPEDA